MKTECNSIIYPKRHLFTVVCVVALVLQFGVLASSAQTGQYLFSGTETTITLNPGTYDITAFGAQGGSNGGYFGGLGAEMEGKFNFTTATTLTLLVGEAGGNGTYAGGGGGGSFVVNEATPLVVAGGGGGSGYNGNGVTGVTGGSGGNGGGVYAGYGGGGSGGGSGGGLDAGGGAGSFLSGGGGGSGGYGSGGGGGLGGGGGGGYSGGGGGSDSGYSGGGGGSIIDSSAIMVLAKVSGVASPDGSPNGEIIITAVPEPTSLALFGFGAAGLLAVRFNQKN